MEEMVAVVRAGQAISASLDLASVLERASEVVASLVKADWAYILLPVGEGGDEYTVAARYGWWGQHKKQEPLVHRRVAVRLADFSLLRHAIARNRQVLADKARDYDQFELLHDLLGRPQSGPTLIQPLSWEERIVGVMLLGRVGREESFGPAECDLCQLMAPQVATALENARRHRDVEERVQQLTASLGQQEEEAAWRQRLLESLAVGLIVWNAAGEPLLINGPAQRLLEQALAQSPEATLERLHERLAAAGEGSPAGLSLVEWAGRAIEASLTPIQDVAAGADWGEVALLRDVTDEHRFEQARRAYLTAAAHELHADLSSLREQLATLAGSGEGRLLPPQRTLARALVSAERLVSAVSNLLIASELGAEEIEVDARPVDMGAVVEQAVRVLEGRFEGRRLDVTLNIPADLRPAWGDPAALRQIVGNLLDSALSSAGAGGRITVWAAQVQLEDDRELFREYLVLNIRGTASGAPVEEEARVSGAFQRIVDAATPEGAVWEMDLAVTKALVEAHGGHLWVESQPGAGSTFRFTIPAAGKQAGPASEAG